MKPPAERDRPRPLFAVVGATGDLMRRKLLPALYGLSAEGWLPPRSAVLGVARSHQVQDETFRSDMRDALVAARRGDEEAIDRWCRDCLHYQTLGGETPADWRALSQRIRELEGAQKLSGNRVFYLALPLSGFPSAVRGLGEAGLAQGPGWTRLVIEKPFGRDLASARELNGLVHRYFDESQVYRIDHYLGKETVQNLMVFRFANMLFESLWNRDRVERVEITVAERIGVEKRAGYYEEAGALRDMVQNHLTQLLTLMAMEVPATYDSEAIRNEKVKVLRSVPPVSPEDAVFGQYGAGREDDGPAAGYRQEPGVSPQSRTETFVALKLEVVNWRWHGVPFYLRTGKRLKDRLTQIVVTFRTPPVSFFGGENGGQIPSNQLRITLQPDEGFDLVFEVKAPGHETKVQTEKMRFRYSEAFGPLPDDYQTLLLDVLQGDQTLFVRADEVEASWRLYEPLLREPPPVHAYSAGSWGPPEADRMAGGRSPWTGV
jgi:glucose-6-phosphate 1-dehydrogenase